LGVRITIRLAAFKGYMSLQPTRQRGKYAA
jgi:hypothetical protein